MGVDVICGIGTIGEIETDKHEHCVSTIRSCCSTLPSIVESETFHYSPLRGNFALCLCEDWSGRFVVGHSLRAEALVECEGRKAVCCGDWSPPPAFSRLLARSMSPLRRLRRHRRDTAADAAG